MTPAHAATLLGFALPVFLTACGVFVAWLAWPLLDQDLNDVEDDDGELSAL